MYFRYISDLHLFKLQSARENMLLKKKNNSTKKKWDELLDSGTMTEHRHGTRKAAE